MIFFINMYYFLNVSKDDTTDYTSTFIHNSYSIHEGVKMCILMSHTLHLLGLPREPTQKRGSENLAATSPHKAAIKSGGTEFKTVKYVTHIYSVPGSLLVKLSPYDTLYLYFPHNYDLFLKASQYELANYTLTN